MPAVLQQLFFFFFFCSPQFSLYFHVTEIELTYEYVSRRLVFWSGSTLYENLLSIGRKAKTCALLFEIVWELNGNNLVGLHACMLVCVCVCVCVCVLCDVCVYVCVSVFSFLAEPKSIFCISHLHEVIYNKSTEDSVCFL